MSLAAYEVDPLSIRKWLECVDNHLSGEAVSFLALGLYSEAITMGCEKELLGVKTASDVYNFLFEKCFQANHIKAFQWFVFALQELGHDLRGYYLVNKCLKEYSLTIPSPLGDHEMSENFRFFHCLVKIGTKARGMELEMKLKRRFSKRKYLHMNHRNIRNLPELFLRLHQRKIITWDDTHHLVEALSKHGAIQCLCYLNEYHKAVKLPTISEVENMSLGIVVIHLYVHSKFMVNIIPTILLYT